jgi:hypothetical protein
MIQRSHSWGYTQRNATQVTPEASMFITALFLIWCSFMMCCKNASKKEVVGVQDETGVDRIVLIMLKLVMDLLLTLLLCLISMFSLSFFLSF